MIEVVVVEKDEIGKEFVLWDESNDRL